MIATVKIIPYAAPSAAVHAAVDGATRYCASRLPCHKRGADLDISRRPKVRAAGQEPRSTGSQAESLGGDIVFERRVPHETEALAAALREARRLLPGMFFVFGASAIADRRDIIPAANIAAGGEIQHFGMPVDPGNLLLLAKPERRSGDWLAELCKIAKVQWLRFRAAAALRGYRGHRQRNHAHGRRRPVAGNSSRPQPRAAEHSALRAPESRPSCSRPACRHGWAPINCSRNGAAKHCCAGALKLRLQVRRGR